MNPRECLATAPPETKGATPKPHGLHTRPNAARPARDPVQRGGRVDTHTWPMVTLPGATVHGSWDERRVEVGPRAIAAEVRGPGCMRVWRLALGGPARDSA